MAERLALFATTARGTEDLLAEELKELGARRIRQDRGGVRFMASLDEALKVCLWSRIAMRVLYPLGEFEAHGAQGLYDAVASVPWEEHLTPETTFAVEATLKDSEHSHTGFVALKVKDAIVDRMREKLKARPDVDTRHPDVSVVAHLVRERLSLSLDLCGEPLHRRGYRVRPTPAPLKETLAAALLRAAGYTGEEALVDPMCGSGTILIEGGLIARRRAPGIARDFAVEKWPHLGERARELLADLRADARRNERKVEVPDPRLRQGPGGAGGGAAQREGGEAGGGDPHRGGRCDEAPSPARFGRPPHHQSALRRPAGLGRPEGDEELLLQAGRHPAAAGLAHLRALGQPGLRERLPCSSQQPEGPVERPHRLHAARLPGEA